MLNIPSRVIASCFAFVGFAGGVVVGLAAGNPLSTILVRAVGVMAVCFVVGLVLGHVLQKAVDLHIEEHKHNHPIPGHAEDTTTEPEADPRGGGATDTATAAA